MKRVGMTAVVALALAVGAGATTATASATWPAHCHNFKCVNQHLNALHQQALSGKKKSFVTYLFNCAGEFPESVDVSTGDFFLTASGDTPDVWALSDLCNNAPAAPTRGLRIRHLPRVASMVLN
jgi:hypothetical protein